MRNKVLTAALGLCLAASSVAVDYVYTCFVYEDRVIEHNKYEAINADPHATYNGYTVAEFGAGYQRPSVLFERVSVNVPLINQYPELPVGCEPTCAAAVLQYLGFDTDKFDFTDNYLEWDDNFYYDTAKNSHGPDPRKVFAGNPYKWGYGCSDDVLAEAMNRFFIRNGANCTAFAADTVLNTADIEKLLDEGVPIIVWATIDMKGFNYRKANEWIIEGSRETYCWYSNSHTLVLCGYDGNCYYFMDPNNKDEITAYLKSTFLKRFEENGYQAVLVKIFTED